MGGDCWSSSPQLSSFRTSPFVYKILHLASLLRDRGGSVGLGWVPSHMGIAGNESADLVARSASRLPFVVQCEFRGRTCSGFWNGTTSLGADFCGRILLPLMAGVVTLIGSFINLLDRGFRGSASPGATYPWSPI